MKVGNAVVKIYQHVDKRWGGKYVTYRVVEYVKGRRRVHEFGKHSKALSEAKRFASQMSSGNVKAANMTHFDATMFGQVMQLLKSAKECAGDSLLTAVDRYVQSAKILGSGTRVVPASEAFVKLDSVPSKTVRQIIDDMIKEKEGKREERTISDLRNRLNKFEESFRCPIASITMTEIQEWLDKLETSERDKINYRSKVGTLFNWAWRRGYVLSNPVKQTERPEAEDSKIEIYTPAQLERLIAATFTVKETGAVNAYIVKLVKDFRPCLLIGAFAGLRSTEIMRLTWEEVNLARGHIVASSKKKGTPSRRLVPIQPNLAAWLADYSKLKGNVWPGTDYQFSDAQYYVAAATAVEADPKKGIEAQEQIEWKHNGLRHSFISYRLAVLQDDAKTALEAGNSTDTVHGHYKELVTPEEATVWFSIQPEIPANVIQVSVSK